MTSLEVVLVYFPAVVIKHLAQKQFGIVSSYTLQSIIGQPQQELKAEAMEVCSLLVFSVCLLIQGPPSRIGTTYHEMGPPTSVINQGHAPEICTHVGNSSVEAPSVPMILVCVKVTRTKQHRGQTQFIVCESVLKSSL